MSQASEQTPPLQEASMQADSSEDKAIDFTKSTKYSFALVSMIQEPFIDYIQPVLYLKAAGEGIFLMLLISWILTFIFNPAIISKNPLKT
jgi:hypothetical protein